MNVDKFAGAFEQALLENKPEPLRLQGDVYDHMESLGLDVSGFERAMTSDEIHRALKAERVRGEYLRLHAPASGKKQKPYKAQFKAKLKALQLAALVKS